MIPSQLRRAALAAASLLTATSIAQTYTSCNPLTTTCPADTALGMAINVDFTKGSVNSFVASGGSPTYGSDGVSFTVARGGDAPQLTSAFYLMFGRVELTMRAAPGAGIVSSLVLQSDCLDEIDFEWIGSDAAQVQTNYFGKGQTGDYNRGQFNPAPGNQAGLVTYTIDWTADRIVWSVGGTQVRTLAYNDAAAGQYPQTPMQVKFGAWSGGDPSNAPGTIQWAGGPTDYSKGPFSMLVRSVAVTDYSTGKEYRYGDHSGTWQSIVAVGGAVNANPVSGGGGAAVTATASAVSGANPTVPVGGIGGNSESTAVVTASGPLPSGWVMTSSGKIVPASSTIGPQASSPSQGLSPSASQPGSVGEMMTVTAYDGKGFPITTVVPTDWTRTYDSLGFQTVSTPPPATATGDSGLQAPKEGYAAFLGRPPWLTALALVVAAYWLAA